jgi:uncharacterized membrane protein YuzA (DUF378 family)
MSRGFDIFIAVLLIIGGLNWGLVGFFNFNLVSALFGDAVFVERVIYAVVGLAGLYRIFLWKRMSCRICPPISATT